MSDLDLLKRHIYAGGSHKMWCGAKFGNHREIVERINRDQMKAPATEGEALSGVHHDLCSACADALRRVRG